MGAPADQSGDGWASAAALALPPAAPRPSLPPGLAARVADHLLSGRVLTEEEKLHCWSMPQHLFGEAAARAGVPHGEANPEWLRWRSGRPGGPDPAGLPADLAPHADLVAQCEIGPITGSAVGSVVRRPLPESARRRRQAVENPYTGPAGLLKDKLWGTFQGNAATRWGGEHEPSAEAGLLAYLLRQHAGVDGADAVRVLAAYTPAAEACGAWACAVVVEGREANVDGRRVALERAAAQRLELSFEHPGIVHGEGDLCGRLAMSPDGVLTMRVGADGAARRFLLEHKCPYSRRDLTVDELDAAGTIYKREDYGPDLGELGVPRYYYAQVQMGMALLGLPECLLTVWTPPRAGRFAELARGPRDCLAATPAGCVQVTQLPFSPEYWDHVRPQAIAWHRDYAEKCVLKAAGVLQHGEVAAPG